ncbi:hypothetical protein WJX84_000490, partial [Apatococcus fuscideae]
ARTILSQNTTDTTSNRAFTSLKAAFPTWDDVRTAAPGGVEESIRVGGLAEIKTQRLKAILNTLVEERGEASMEYIRAMNDGEIKEELMRFKGVGKKTVACVLMFCLHRHEFPVDTHVWRIAKRLGWVPAKASRDEAYEHLNMRVPDDIKYDLHVLLVGHETEAHPHVESNAPYPHQQYRLQAQLPANTNSAEQSTSMTGAQEGLWQPRDAIPTGDMVHDEQRAQEPPLPSNIQPAQGSSRAGHMTVPVARDGTSQQSLSAGPHALFQVDPPEDDGKGNTHKAGGMSSRPTRQFPWRPGPIGRVLEALRRFLLSGEFQQMLQLAAGQFLLALFVFVRPMTYYESCLAVIFFVAAMLLIGRQQNVGSRLQASANIIGWYWPGLALGGGVVSLARALHHIVYPLWLVIFCILALIPLSIVRVYNLGLGIISSLAFGIIVLLGESLWPAYTLWRMGVTNILFVGLCASAGTLFAGLFVLPTLARDEMRDEVETLMRGIGHSLSGYASHMFVPDQPPAKPIPADTTASRRKLMMARMQEEITSDEQYSKVVWESSDPKLIMPPRHAGLPFSPDITGLRPQLQRARMLLGDAGFEPPWLSWQQVPLDKWKVVLDKLDRLVIQVAALESVLEGPEPLLSEKDVEEALGHSIIPIFRLIYAQLAGSLAALAKAVHADLHCSRKMDRLQMLFEPSWGILELELASVMHSTIKSYGALYSGQDPADLYTPVPTVRAVMYVQTLTSSIMEAVAESEAAIVAALSHRYTLKHVTTTEERVEQDMTASMRHRVQRPVHEANAVDQEDDDRGPHDSPPASRQSPATWQQQGQPEVADDSPAASRQSSATWQRQGRPGFVAGLVGSWERRASGAEYVQPPGEPATGLVPPSRQLMQSANMETYSTIEPMIPSRNLAGSDHLDTHADILASQDISPSIMASKLTSTGEMAGFSEAEDGLPELLDSQAQDALLQTQHADASSEDEDVPDTGTTSQPQNELPLSCHATALSEAEQDDSPVGPHRHRDGQAQHGIPQAHRGDAVGWAGDGLLGGLGMPAAGGSQHGSLHGRDHSAAGQPENGFLSPVSRQAASVAHSSSLLGRNLSAASQPEDDLPSGVDGGAASTSRSSSLPRPYQTAASQSEDGSPHRLGGGTVSAAHGSSLHGPAHGVTSKLADGCPSGLGRDAVCTAQPRSPHGANTSSPSQPQYSLPGGLFVSGAGNTQATFMHRPDVGDASKAHSSTLHRQETGVAAEDDMPNGHGGADAWEADHDLPHGPQAGPGSQALDALQHGHNGAGHSPGPNISRQNASWDGQHELHVSIESDPEGRMVRQSQNAPVSLRRNLGERPLWKLPLSHFADLEDLACRLRSRTPTSRRLARHEIREQKAAPGDSATEKWKRLLWPQIAWTVPLLEALCASIMLPIFKDVGKRCMASCKSRKALASNTWQNRYFQFGIKYWLAYSLSLAVIIPLQYISTGFVSWSPYYVMITVVVVLCEKVEVTLLKGIIRIITTIIGCVIGYLFMLRSNLATNPYGLMALLCVVTFLSGYFSLGPFKYAVFLLLITSNALVLCQYQPVPGHTGTVLSFYSRIVDIVVGVVYCLLLDLIWPWYTSSAALEGMGGTFKRCMSLIGTFNMRFIEELQVADVPQDERSGSKGIAETGPLTLGGGIYSPLGGVQLMLILNSVIWKKALLGTPPIVHRTFASMRVLADRLTAAEIMMQQKPIITGRYTSAPYQRFMLPMEAELKEVGQAMLGLGDAVVAVLSERGSAREMAALQQAIDVVQDRRMHFRRKYLQLQHDLALAVVEEGGAEAMHGRNVQRPLPGGRDSPASHYSTEDDGAEPGRTMVAAFATPDDAHHLLLLLPASTQGYPADV